MQPLTVVHGFDKGSDGALGLAQIAILFPLISSCFRVFMKLSALALS